MSEPPDEGLKAPRGCDIDFSVFHPLFHWAFSRECFGWHGGPVQHIRLWWDYQAPDPVGSLLCRLGRHDMGPYWQGRGFIDVDVTPPTGYSCRRCHKHKEE